ncbi:MAG: Smr/MutS family protein, partial [Anaerolineales bacterium]
VEEQVQRPVKSKVQDVRAIEVLKPGDKVVLRTLGTEGILSSIDVDEAEVQAGTLRLRVRLEELKRKETEPETSDGKREIIKQTTPMLDESPTRSALFVSSPGMELDLRGQRAEDALDMLDRYLEKAYLAGLPFVRIIHGKGTGKLRQEVRAALKGHPNVDSFEEGGEKEGGEGVTVAKLAVG